MAITSQGPHAAAGAPAPTVQPGLGAGATATGAQKAPGGLDFATAMATFGAISGVSEDVEKYMKKIRDSFGTEGYGAGIAIHRLGEPSGTYAFVKDGAAIILIFTSLVTASLADNRPLSEYGFYANEALKRVDSKARLIGFNLVGPEDHERAVQMAHYIMRSFVAETQADMTGANIKMFANNEFVVESDIIAVRNFVNQLSPHAVMPRIDTGFVVYHKRPRKQGLNVVQGESDLQAIMAVGGFTEFRTIQVQESFQMVNKFLPVFRITAIETPMPLPGIAPLALNLAVSEFTDGAGRAGRWRDQFNVFVKGKPNIGNLIMDQTGKSLWHCPDIVARNDFIAKYCAPAVLGVDVVEGRARLPGLRFYSDVAYANQAYDVIHNFFPGINVDRRVPPFGVGNVEYIGTYGEAGGLPSDSRNIDYLTLVAQRGLDAQSQSLLQYYPDPAVRARIVADNTSNFRSTNRCTVAVLNSSVAEAMSLYVQQNMSIKASAGLNQPLSTDWLLAQSQFYGTHAFSATQQGYRPQYPQQGFY